MSASSFYNKISQIAANELIDFLEHNQSEIILKIHKNYIKSNIIAKKGIKKFTITKFSSFDFSNEPVLCSFQVKEELYFFRSFLNGTATDYSIEIPDSIHQLQRRNDYRVAMPFGVSYVCKIYDINGTSQNLKAEIRDISLGGCQISLPSKMPELQADDRLLMQFTHDRFDFPGLDLTVKHIKIVEGQNNTLIGASYTDSNNTTFLAELQALIMHLDRIQRGVGYE